jgi:hypothetical protein
LGALLSLAIPALNFIILDFQSGLLSCNNILALPHFIKIILLLLNKGFIFKYSLSLSLAGLPEKDKRAVSTSNKILFFKFGKRSLI